MAKTLAALVLIGFLLLALVLRVDINPSALEIAVAVSLRSDPDAGYIFYYKRNGPLRSRFECSRIMIFSCFGPSPQP